MDNLPKELIEEILSYVEYKCIICNSKTNILENIYSYEHDNCFCSELCLWSFYLSS